jgi:S1-C subfamily serine protease
VVLLVILLVVALGQTVALVILNGKVDRADRAQSAAQAADAKQLSDLKARADALEKQAAASLDPQAVATAVLPSVFKVEAGDFSGTAFVIKSDASGSTLITNYHVVSDLYEGGGRTVALTHDDQRFSAKIVDHNADDDIAVLQTTDKFPALAAAKADVQTGQPIVVVGAPLGLEQSVTTGVVSAIRNDVPGEGGRTYIQFSAPINPGNSGGPVVDAQKEVVGIASAKAQDAEAIGLAIPIAVACKDFSVC